MAREAVQGLPLEATVKTGSQGEEVRRPIGRRNFGWLFLATLSAVAGGSAVVVALSGGGEQAAAGGGNQAQATDGFPDCNFANGGFVETDLQGNMYQCLDGEWKGVGDEPIREEVHSYVDLSKSLSLDVGGTNIAHAELKVERFIPGDVDASVSVGLGQGMIEQKVSWDQREGELRNQGTFFRDLLGRVWVNTK